MIPALLITLVVALLCGTIRGVVLFIPGIQGMIAGGLVGYSCGCPGRFDDSRWWGFSARSGLTLGAALIYLIGTTAVVAGLNAGLAGYPLEWLADVIDGSKGELFFGTSVNSLQSVGGKLRGGWWLVFVLLDAALFAFLHLVSFGIGLSSEREKKHPHNESPIITQDSFNADSPNLGLLGFGSSMMLTIALVGLLAAWPSMAIFDDIKASVQVSLADLQGEWIFDQEVTLFGGTELARRFTLSIGIGEEMAGFSAEKGLYMIIVKPRNSGIFEGRILLKGKGELPTQMRVSPDQRQLTFTVEGITRSGAATRRQMIAQKFD